MLRDQLVELLEPVVSELGYELWELEYTGQSGNGLLRLYIDSDEGISVEDCERVSRAVSAAMDVADPIASNYTLEVSSPGLDRVLAKREHFIRFTGEPVRVEMSRPIGGRKRFSGLLVKVEGDALTLEMDGSIVSLPLDGIHKARLAPEV
jgi:ribosome maturation factor RimP